MCELSVYKVRGDESELVMDGVVRLTVSEGKVLMEGILGESLEVAGTLLEVDVTSARALVASA